ncbi:MAG: rane-flanked domain protein [Chloroflexi bacterium]|nr:rane-flanked domain protein [Chloroflexota bacterium]
MTYADSLLAANERVLRRERQHWMFPILVAGRWVAIAVVVFVVGFLLANVVKSNGTGGAVNSLLDLLNSIIWIVTVLALVFAAIGLVWSTIQWQTQEYLLTDRRVMHVKGVINKQSTDSSLENVTDASIQVPWLGRIMGFGDLEFMTAAESGLEELRTVKSPVEFKKQFMEAKNERLVEINTPRMPSPPIAAPAVMSPSMVATAQAAPAAPAVAVPPAEPIAPEPPVPAVSSTADELRELAKLRDEGILTPEEFDAKKAELLGKL